MGEGAAGGRPSSPRWSDGGLAQTANHLNSTSENQQCSLLNFIFPSYIYSVIFAVLN